MAAILSRPQCVKAAVIMWKVIHFMASPWTMIKMSHKCNWLNYVWGRLVVCLTTAFFAIIAITSYHIKFSWIQELSPVILSTFQDVNNITNDISWPPPLDHDTLEANPCLPFSFMLIIGLLIAHIVLSLAHHCSSSILSLSPQGLRDTVSTVSGTLASPQHRYLSANKHA